MKTVCVYSFDDIDLHPARYGTSGDRPISRSACDGTRTCDAGLRLWPRCHSLQLVHGCMFILSAPTLCRHCVGSNCFPCFRAASSRGKTFVALRCQMRGTASLNPSHQKLAIPPKSLSVIFFSRTRKRMDGRRNERAARRPWTSTIHRAHLGLICPSCSIPKHWAR